MNATLSIKDLEISKELSGKELASVRGGFNFSSNGGQVIQAAGGGIASPLTVVGSYAPTTVQGGDTTTKVDLSTMTNVLGQFLGQNVQS